MTTPFFAVTSRIAFTKPGCSGTWPQPAPANAAEANVSIMTEALPATAGSDEDAIGELARAYAGAGLPRILAVRGLGPVANMHDLLHMRGIDMAVVNADLFAYARITGELPGIETRLSAVAKLYEKTVYLVAAKGVTGVADLAHQRVLVPGLDSDSFVTARTMFGQLGIPADVEGTQLGQAITDVASGKAKALLLTLEEDDQTLAALPPDQGLHVLAIPEAATLDKLYGRHALTAESTSGLGPDGGSTITVASLLATFNWKPSHARYTFVVQFIRSLPKVIGQLRASSAKDIWQDFDGRADPLGWQRYEPARPLLATIAPAVAPLTAPQPHRTAVAAKTAATSSALANLPSADALATTVPNPAAEAAPPAVPATPLAIEVEAFSKAFLTDAKDTKGGLLAELVKAGLKSDLTSVTWATDGDAAQSSLAGSKKARIALPFARPDCEHADTLAAAAAALCEHYDFSKPIFQALQVLFVRHGSDVTFERDDQMVGRSVCVVAQSDLASLDAGGRRWLKDDLITLLQRPSLEACFDALAHEQVDSVFGDDLSGRALLQQRGLTEKIEVARRPVATLDFCAIAAKDNADGLAALRRLDAGIAAAKADGRYSDIVMGRLGQQQLSGDVPALQ